MCQHRTLWNMVMEKNMRLRYIYETKIDFNAFLFPRETFAFANKHKNSQRIHLNYYFYSLQFSCFLCTRLSTLLHFIHALIWLAKPQCSQLTLKHIIYLIQCLKSSETELSKSNWERHPFHQMIQKESRAEVQTLMPCDMTLTFSNLVS